jgi:hypothetical protein
MREERVWWGLAICQQRRAKGEAKKKEKQKKGEAKKSTQRTQRQKTTHLASSLILWIVVKWGWIIVPVVKPLLSTKV